MPTREPTPIPAPVPVPASVPISVPISVLVWVIAWYVAQILAHALGAPGRLFTLTVFTVGYAALAGVALALATARRIALPLRPPTAPLRRRAGYVVLAATVGVGVIGGGAAADLAASPPAPDVVLKYVLLFAPMALGVTLQAFVLTPGAVERAARRTRLAPIAGPLAVVAGAAVVGLGFWADQRLLTTDLAVVQACLGAGFATGAVLSRDAVTTAVAYFAVMLPNTLAEDKYAAFPWAPVVLGAVVTASAVALTLRSRRSAAPRPGPDQAGDGAGGSSASAPRTSAST